MSDYYNIIDSAEKIAVKKGLEIGREQGLAEGLEQGREEGREEEKLTTAAKLKALGVDPVLISEATGLSEDVIDKLS